MPSGIPKKAAKSGQVNKAELIRKTAKSMGKSVRPRDIIAALKKQGVVVTSQQVSKTLKAAGFHRRTRGKRAAAAPSNATEMSKAQRIRDVAKTLGRKVRPRDVIAELAKEGITVSSAQVSMTLRSAGYRRKRRGRTIASETASKPRYRWSAGCACASDRALAMTKTVEQSSRTYPRTFKEPA